MTTPRKLMLGFGALIALVVLALFGVSLQLLDLRNHAETVTNVAGPLSAAAYEMDINALGFGVGVLRYVTTGDADGRDRAEARATDFNHVKANFDRLATTPTYSELRSRLDALYPGYLALGRALIAQKDGAGKVDADELRRFGQIRAQLGDLLGEEIHAVAQSDLLVANEGAHERADDRLSTVFLLLALGTALAIATSVLVSRGIIRSEETLRVTLAGISDGVIALRASEARLRRLTDSNIIGVMYTDDDGEVTEANDAFLEMIGYTREELRAGKVLSCQITSEEHLLLDKSARLEAVERGVCTAYEKEYRRPDGKRIPVLLGCARLGGVGAGNICYVLDLSTRKTLEAELRQNAVQLKDADRRKDEFLATLAHELRNPLAPIRNALETMKRAGGDTATMSQARQVMERQLHLLVLMVDDLLDVSRITLGKITLDRQRVELGRIIEVAVETVRPLFKTASQDLRVDLPTQPIYLEGDPARLAQVFSNLLNNASKYTPENGRVSVQGERDGKQVVVRVRDNGVGVAREMLPRIFEIFTQVDSSLDRAQGGLGIGLTLVKSLIEIHDGSIEALSEGQGKGSEFVIRLPAAADQDASVPATASDALEPSNGAPRRVLVVDDSRDAAKSLGILLEITGNEVRLAHDGTGAIAAALAFHPDVVLLDIGMPGMDGHEVARRMRELPELQKTVLVAVTGWGTDEDRRRSHDAGFDHHLVKPVNFDDLQRLLEGIGSA